SGPPPDAAPEVLYLGQSSPLFLSLQNALNARGVSVTAALTRITVNDFLSTRKFSAALIDLTSASDNSTRLLDADAPGELLNGLPILALIDGDKRVPDDAQDLLSRADEIVECQDPEPDVVGRIETLARKYLAMIPARAASSITRGVRDDATGLFSSAFLVAHLERQMLVSDQRADALSVMTLKLVGARRADAQALAAFASCLAPLLRETDCAAIVETGTIAVSMPMTPYRGGIRLANRIAEAVLDAPDLAGIALNWRVVEKRSSHTAKDLLETALSGPFMRLDAA
uniref:hypothetical protein n=1 Tax=Hyphomonas sp. TaxID=87 RepID=UPI0030F4EC99